MSDAKMVVPPKKINEALNWCESVLGAHRGESELLVTEAYRRASGRELTRFEIYLNPTTELSTEATGILLNFAEERVAGKPIQYIVGHQQFLEHRYIVRPGVLIPRPETEALVAKAIRVLRAMPVEPRLGLEVGLGSGAISIEILCAFPRLLMLASELSAAALECGSENAKRILKEGAGRLSMLPVRDPSQVLDVFSQPLQERKADFLITNPPYLRNSSDEVDGSVLDSEPAEALFPYNGDPLHFYREIAEAGRNCLEVGGWIFAEIAHERVREVSRLFVTRSWDVQIQPDLTGRDRILMARLMKAAPSEFGRN